jgi:hypothetical protein|tara:strand:- start:31127 stop:31303 length:177 start_codon:yes stop_codon:yes gene_type:complete
MSVAQLAVIARGDIPRLIAKPAPNATLHQEIGADQHLLFLCIAQYDEIVCCSYVTSFG